MDTKPQSLDRHRQDDPPFQITRSIPLPWLLSVLAAMFGQAAIVYFTQQAQGDKIQAMTAELKQLSATINIGTLKAAEHDFRIADHERRLQNLERGK